MARAKNQGSNWIRKDKRLAIYLRDGMACTYCGRGVEHGSMLTLDHLLACELGGGNSPDNLVTACRGCNSSKRDLPLAGWLQVLADRGVDTDEMAARLARLTATPIDRTAAKAIIAAR